VPCYSNLPSLYILFIQSLLLQPHSSLQDIAPVVGCHNSSNHKIFPHSQDLQHLDFQFIVQISNTSSMVQYLNSIPNCLCSLQFQQCHNDVTPKLVVIPAFLKSRNNAKKKKTNLQCFRKKKIPTCFRNSCVICPHMQTVYSAITSNQGTPSQNPASTSNTTPIIPTTNPLTNTAPNPAQNPPAMAPVPTGMDLTIWANNQAPIMSLIPMLQMLTSQNQTPPSSGISFMNVP